MKAEDSIQRGDLVRVDFHASKYTLTSKAEVIYCPCSDGDHFILKDLDNDDKIIYLNERCTITRLK
jgi:hypothetical protein